jgi:tight adherence protein B
MRLARRLTALAAAFGAAAALGGAAGAASELPLRELAGARFPDRAFLLSLPEPVALDPNRITVRENGEPVAGLTVLPASAAGTGDFAVALVIDASNSMRGDAIAGALDAARAFAAERGENQAVAVLAFNAKTEVVLPFTTGEEEIQAALASPPRLAEGTHMRDAVDLALGLLAEQGATVGSVVVLSDGADTGSSVTGAALAERATRAGIRIFTVGLRSGQFAAEPLETLARSTDGRYAEASSAEALERVFADLGSRLASEYLIRYRSEAPPDLRVHVAVRVEEIAGVGVSQYVTPAAPGNPGPPFRRPLLERFVQSEAGTVATSLAFALVVALGLVALLRPRPRTLRRRMAEFVSVALGERTSEPGAPNDLVLARAEKSLAETRWWERFREELDIGEVRIPPMHILLATLVGTLFVAWVLLVLTGTLLFVPLGLGVAFFVRGLIARRAERQRNLFAEQLPDNLHVISSALRAGHSLSGALAVLVDDCAEPSQREFKRVVADERLGAPLDETLGVVARRMQSRDLEQVALVAALQRETGGNTAEVLDRVADTVRGRFELRRLVRTLTTQGRMSRWVLSLLPVGLLLLMTLINPAYVAPLYFDPIGRVLLVVAGLMVVTGSLVIKRIINIKV